MSLDITLSLDGECVYDANITHNLNKMAMGVSVKFYKALWRPDEIGLTVARELKLILVEGLMELLNQPDKYKQYNPENGWGNYEGLCDVVFHYIQACIRHPESTIKVWR